MGAGCRFWGAAARPHPKPAAKLACKTLQKIDNIVTNATYSIFYRAVFYSLSRGLNIFQVYNIFPSVYTSF